MGFFSNRKPKVIRGIKEDKAFFSIDYYKCQAPEEYKKRLFDKILGPSVCLAVLNSELMYKDQKASYISDALDILGKLDTAEVIYKSIPIRRKEDIVIMGLTVKRNKQKFYDDQIIGLIVDSSSFKVLSPILNSFNVYYYVCSDSCSVEELLSRFEAGYEHREKLEEGSDYVVIDDNFMKKMALYCKKEDADKAAAILDSI